MTEQDIATQAEDVTLPGNGLPAPGSSARTRVHRHGERAVRERQEMYAVLDDGLVAHVAFVADSEPVVLPMAYARDGDRLLLHGSSRNRMLRLICEGAPLCAVVTVVDGLVLAHSAFNHSMNYRSVVVYGRGCEIADPAEKARALDLFVDFLLPGRSAELPEHTSSELATTTIVELALDEVSVKARAGGPNAAPPGRDKLPWMGVIPLTVTRGAAQPLTGGSPGD